MSQFDKLWYNDGEKPFFQKTFGGTATQKQIQHSTPFQDKTPEDKTYLMGGGQVVGTDFASRKPVPNRNQRPARGHPYDRQPLQGFNRKSVNRDSAVERYILADTYSDGLRKSTNITETNIDKQTTIENLNEEVAKIDNEIKKVRGYIEDEKDLGEIDRLNELVNKLESEKEKLQVSINPNYKLEQGIGKLVNLFQNFRAPQNQQMPQVEMKKSKEGPFEDPRIKVFGAVQNYNFIDLVDLKDPEQSALNDLYLRGVENLSIDARNGILDNAEYSQELSKLNESYVKILQGIEDRNSRRSSISSQSSTQDMGGSETTVSNQSSAQNIEFKDLTLSDMPNLDKEENIQKFLNKLMNESK